MISTKEALKIYWNCRTLQFPIDRQNMECYHTVIA